LGRDGNTSRSIRRDADGGPSFNRSDGDRRIVGGGDLRSRGTRRDQDSLQRRRLGDNDNHAVVRRGDQEFRGRGDRRDGRFDAGDGKGRHREFRHDDDRFRGHRSHAGRFLRFYHYPYRSFGLYWGRPYYRDYGYSLYLGGGYDGYYFDYRSDYYLDSYLGLGCYHYQYDPVCVYPAPTGYAAVAVDPSIQFDEEKQFSGDEMLALAEDAFYARDYQQAVRWLRHAVIELPNDPKVLMLLSQALFAVGEFGEAAGAAQAGMLVAEDAAEWDVIIGNYREYYSDTQDYVDQLKALEDHVFKGQPDDHAARFLVGVQYGLLGYPKQSVRELDIVLQSAPDDRLAREFRRRMAEQLGLAEPAPQPAVPGAISGPGDVPQNPSLPPAAPTAPTQPLPPLPGVNGPANP
jgi:tetratricopeptide (TPR) repeat protein